MSQIIFNTANDVSQDWLFYIENEARSLAQRDDFSIDNYIDREAFNPDMATYLSADSSAALFKTMLQAPSVNLNLNLVQEMRANFLPDWLRPRFKHLKDKIKKIFCQAVKEIGEIDVKAIIKAVLLALIPVFAAGIPALCLPIIIGFIAFLLKYGYERTCPV